MGTRLVAGCLLALIVGLWGHTAPAQRELTIQEKKSADVCGKWVIVLDSIWKDDEGNLRADLVTFRSNAVSKPMSGGYSVGKTIEVDSGCSFSVTKIDAAKRQVILSPK